MQWERAGRGGDSSSLAARPQAAWFNMKRMFGLCFCGPVSSSGGAEAEAEAEGTLLLPWDRDVGQGQD